MLGPCWLLADERGGATHIGGCVLHSIVDRELQVFGSSGGDGDSAWCGASSFSCGADRGRHGPGACRRSLPRKTVNLRQFPTFAVCEISSRGVPNLALRTARSAGRVRADGDAG